jgi:hypothetical protein
VNTLEDTVQPTVHRQRNKRAAVRPAGSRRTEARTYAGQNSFTAETVSSWLPSADCVTSISTVPRYNKQNESKMLFIYLFILTKRRSPWPPGLRHEFAAARLLVLWLRIPPWAWMPVSFGCCVLSGRVSATGRSVVKKIPAVCVCVCVCVCHWVWSKETKTPTSNDKHRHTTVYIYTVVCLTIYHYWYWNNTAGWSNLRLITRTLAMSRWTEVKAKKGRKDNTKVAVLHFEMQVTFCRSVSASLSPSLPPPFPGRPVRL